MQTLLLFGGNVEVLNSTCGSVNMLEDAHCLTISV